jgi:hypothetical protein
MLILEVRRALDGHRAAAVFVGGVDIDLEEAQCGQHVEAEVVELRFGEAELCFAEFLAERPFIEGELNLEGGGQRFLDLGQRLVVEALNGAARRG